MSCQTECVECWEKDLTVTPCDGYEGSYLHLVQNLSTGFPVPTLFNVDLICGNGFYARNWTCYYALTQRRSHLRPKCRMSWPFTIFNIDFNRNSRKFQQMVSGSIASIFFAMDAVMQH